jgi:hypothetical protein
MKNYSNPLGEITQSPDDLMDLPIMKLARKLHERLARQKRIKAMFNKTLSDEKELFQALLYREHALIRSAEIALRSRLRELVDCLFSPMT